MEQLSVNRRQFQILLQQLNMTDDTFMTYFEDGEIDKLTIHKAEKAWHFQFRFKALLPYQIYDSFMMRLTQSFAHIARVTSSVQVIDPTVTEELVQDYWTRCIEELEGTSPPMVALLNQQKPKLKGNKLIVKTKTDTEASALKNKYFALIQHSYRQFGFPELQLDTEIFISDQEVQKFREQKLAEDQERAMQALIEMEKKEKEGDEDQAPSGPLVIGYQIKENEEIRTLDSIMDEERRITVQGFVFDAETRELKSGRTLCIFKITDYTNSILVKMFAREKEDAALMKTLKKGMWVKARGSIQNDTFVRDLVMIANDVNEIKAKTREDTAPEGEKRVELHLHSPMSQMDAVTGIGKLVEQAKKWGHEAIALTDHAVVQSFPDAYSAAKKHGIKMIYGMEANIVDDGVPIAYNPAHRLLEEDTYVVFDVETTGLSAVYDTIIELAAVKIRGGEIIDKFEAFANPHHPLSATTIELTGITDDMVRDAPDVVDVVRDFKEWIGDDVLVAHNASFDMGFLNVAYKRLLKTEKAKNPVIDTLELARFLYPEFKNHRLNTLCKKFDIELTQHHRAVFDAEATGYLLLKMLKDAAEKDIFYHDQLNENMGQSNAYQRSRPYHATLLAVNETGLKNLFKLVSISHIQYFYRVPRIPRSQLNKYREGLLIGSACDRGEVFEGMMQKSPEEVEDIASFYDYLEVQPPEVYRHLLQLELVRDEKALKEIIANITKLGEKLNKPVVATGNVHYLNDEDKIYRKILISSQGGANPLNRHELPKVHFRTTDEMLEAFSFLGAEKAKEIVVDNTQKVASMINEIKPIKDDLYTPKIDGADEEIREMSYQRARSIYGEELPEIVEARIEKELKSIIGHGFAVIYLISHKLVKRSLDDGYLVGSRGSVGSSLVATLTEITEVNPLAPHYVCPSCRYSEFFNDGSVGSGFDLPDKSCPSCGTPLKKDGHDIPFETFLGFKGDKVPDIDLNFSGEYQPHAHNYTKVLFGEDNVYRAGTIGTVAEKTAYGYVKGYAGDHNLHMRGAEIDRLVQAAPALRERPAAPGGIIVVPDYMDIYDFSPIQFPADATGSEWKTTHFDFHSIHDNLLKLDILGHDDPTVIRMLQDLSGIDPKTIPTDDPEVMKIFQGTESLGVTEEQIGCKTGTLGIPEFGTRFVRQMLEDTKPTTFSELVQISGLSHGTDVWLGNAQELIHNNTCELSEVIGCRDDIMVYLIYQGLEPSLAFKIMEFVRKGKGLTPEWEEEMKKNNVPNWYIDSCKKIKYMFPKAHAAAYVLMAVRIAYFKVHHALLYYAAYFTVRADDFDIDTMIKGSTAIRAVMDDISSKGLDASPKEKNLLTVLELALEMCERGYSFQKVDLYRSSASEFIIDGNSLIPPFNSIPGLGTNAALNIVKARKEGEFLSKEDLQKRGKVSKTILEYLDRHGCLESLPDQNQLSLF